MCGGSTVKASILLKSRDFKEEVRLQSPKFGCKAVRILSTAVE